MTLSMKMRTKEKLPVLAACLLLLWSPVSSRAWAPGEKDVETAVNTGALADYYAKLSAWLNQQVPARPQGITAESLKPLLNDPGLVSALEVRQFLGKHGVAELEAFARANPANREFLSSLLKNRPALKLYLEATVPVGLKAREQNSSKLSVAPLEIWKKILLADPEARQGLPLRLAIATALRPPGTGNRGAGMETTPGDPVARYHYFKSAHANHELFPSFEKLTVWELQHVVSSSASERDLTWARNMVNTWRPDLRINELVVNSTSEVKYGNSPHPYTNYPAVMSGGGKCGPRSSWSVMICQAFGIPAIGVSQPGHVCVAYKAVDPASQPQPGSAWKVAYGRGWQVSKLEGLSGADFLEGVAERARPAEFAMVEHLRWLAAALTSAEQSAVVMGVARQMQKSGLIVKTDLTASANADEAEKELPPKKSAPAPAPLAKTPVKLGPGVIRAEAAGYSKISGARLQDSLAGGRQIYFEKNNKNGWIEYTLEVPAAGLYAIELKTATPNDGQVLNLSVGATKRATVNIPNTTGLWGTTPATDLRLEQGLQTLRIAAPAQRGVALRSLELKSKN